MSKCTAKAKSTGTQCTRDAVVGLNVCYVHGGNSTRSREKSRRYKEERAATEKAGRALARLGEPTPVNPADALLYLVYSKKAEVDWLRQKVLAIESDQDMVWGVESEQKGSGPQGPVDVTTKKTALNVWWGTLHKAEDQLASYASAALKAGIEERRVRLAEAQGGLIAGAIRRILGALELSPEQEELVPVVVPRELRALTEETA